MQNKGFSPNTLFNTTWLPANIAGNQSIPRQNTMKKLLLPATLLLAAAAHAGPAIEHWVQPGGAQVYVKAVYCHPVYLTYMQSTS